MGAETCWTLIEAVRRGDSSARGRFAERYLGPVRAYLRARWRGGPLAGECEDAAQEVFLRCFSDSGPLEGLQRVADGGFRGFLCGVCRNVAREHEQRRARAGRAEREASDALDGREERLSAAFDRAFAQQVMKEARARYRERAEAGEPPARRRYELLALRFERGLPIRDIARRWDEDAARLHKEYARARAEFREALLEVVAEQNPGRTTAQIDEAARHLVELLG